MRKGFDKLALRVQETLKRDPHSCGHLFVFRGKRGDLVKILGTMVRACACSPNAWSAGASYGPGRRARR